MKRYTLLSVFVPVLILAPLGFADLPPAKDPLRQPAILLPDVPAEWITMYRTAQKNPADLLRYLQEHVAFMSERKKKSFLVGSTTQSEKDQLSRRLYVLYLLGDVAGPDVIPSIEDFIARRVAQDDAMTHYDVAMAKLTIERIQLRTQGREVYISAMLDWVRNGDKTYSGAISDRGQATAEGKQRVLQGAWALGRLKVAEAVPVLVAKSQEGLWGTALLGFPLIRALAQIGDRSTMQIIGNAASDFAGSLVFQHGSPSPLRPGEVDPVWAYWQMRTQGMDLAQTIETMLGALGGDDLLVEAHRVLKAMGQVSVPYLADALKHPRGKDPLSCQRNVAWILGELKAKEAVEPLRDMLRESLLTGNSQLGERIASALGQIGDPSALPELLTAAQSTDFLLQVSAICALGKLADPRAEPLLLELLSNHPDAVVRYRAAEALRTAGTASAIPVLEQRLEVETDRGTRARMQTTLQALRQRMR